MDRPTREFVNGMRKVGRLACSILDHVEPFVKIGTTPAELNTICEDFTRSKGATSAPLGYQGFPASICTSVNNMICHGVPDHEPLEEGDIINIDVTPVLGGFHGDTSRTFIVGRTLPEIEKLVTVAKGAMWEGIQILRPGLHTGDIGYTTEKYITSQGFFPCTDIGGHGIGKKFHDDPFIPASGRRGKGPKLRPWSCITVEPAVNQQKTASVEVEIPGSTITEILTDNDCFSAQFEHTVLITDTGYEIMTISDSF